MSDLPEYLSATVTDQDEYDVINALFSDYDGSKDECIRMSMLREAERRGIDIDDVDLDDEEDEWRYGPDEYDGTLSSEEMRTAIEQDQLINRDHVGTQLPRDRRLKAELVARCALYDGVRPNRDYTERVLRVSSQTAKDYREMIKEEYRRLSGDHNPDAGGVGSDEEVELGPEQADDSLTGLYDDVDGVDAGSEAYIQTAAEVVNKGVSAGVSEEFERLCEDYDRDSVESRVGPVLSDIIGQRLDVIEPGDELDHTADEWYIDEVDEIDVDTQIEWSQLVSGRYDFDDGDEDGGGESVEAMELMSAAEPVTQCVAKAGTDRCPEEAVMGEDYCERHLRQLEDDEPGPVDYVDSS